MVEKANSRYGGVVCVTIILVVVLLLIGIPSLTKQVYSYSKAPDFTLNTLDVKQISLEMLKGKPSILWFMATWCPSCIGQADAIKKITSEYGSKINVVVMDLWAAQNIGGQSAQGLNAETNSDLLSFIAKYGSPEWKGTFDTDKVSIKYGITEVDSTVVIDGNGNIVMKYLGPSGYQPIKDALSKLIII